MMKKYQLITLLAVMALRTATLFGAEEPPKTVVKTVIPKPDDRKFVLKLPVFADLDDLIVAAENTIAELANPDLRVSAADWIERYNSVSVFFNLVREQIEDYIDALVIGTTLSRPMYDNYHARFLHKIDVRRARKLSENLIGRINIYNNGIMESVRKFGINMSPKEIRVWQNKNRIFLLEQLALMLDKHMLPGQPKAHGISRAIPTDMLNAFNLPKQEAKKATETNVVSPTISEVSSVSTSSGEGSGSYLD